MHLSHFGTPKSNNTYQLNPRFQVVHFAFIEITNPNSSDDADGGDDDARSDSPNRRGDSIAFGGS